MKNVPFTDETRRIGPPEGWIEELDGLCMTISVYDYVDEQTGLPYMRTGWQLEPEQTTQLANGGYLVLDISGRNHPVIRIGTTEMNQ